MLAIPNNVRDVTKVTLSQALLAIPNNVNMFEFAKQILNPMRSEDAPKGAPGRDEGHASRKLCLFGEISQQEAAFCFLLGEVNGAAIAFAAKKREDLELRSFVADGNALGKKAAAIAARLTAMEVF